jgi:hypothetical protein
MHDLVEAHETPTRPPPDSGAGAGWIDQRLPFQRSTRGTARDIPETSEPTATHDLGDTHDTPLRLLNPGPTVGVCCTDHLAPFQRSTNGVDGE